MCILVFLGETAQIENSLVERPPMAIGFDIDGTVLFSRPGFWHGNSIWFITGRSQTATESVTTTLQEDFLITAAKASEVRPVRILCASNSTYRPLPQAGAFGEEVVVNSGY